MDLSSFFAPREGTGEGNVAAYFCVFALVFVGLVFFYGLLIFRFVRMLAPVALPGSRRSARFERGVV